MDTNSIRLNDPLVEYQSWHGAPFRTSKPGDVGHDLHAEFNQEEMNWLDKFYWRFLVWRANNNDLPRTMIILPWTSRLVPSKIHVNMPDSVWCQVVARSSTSKKRLMTLGGIIDSGYQGELFAVLANFSFIPRVIKTGERYAQVIFHSAVRPNLVHKREFSKSSERGSTGFGSTGS